MRFIYLIILCCLSIPLLAQKSEPASKRKATKFYIKGEEALLNLDFEKAISHFEKALELNPNLNACHRGLGVGYFGLDRYEEAAVEYVKLLQRDPNFSRAVYYDLGLTYYRAGEYQKALYFFKQFELLQNEDLNDFGYNGEKEKKLEEAYLLDLADDMIACEHALEQLKYTENVIIENLGGTINTKGDEYFPFLSNSQQILFYTAKPLSSRDENLFIATANKGVWEKGHAVSDSFNTIYNEGMPTITIDGRQMYFTSCEYMEGKIDCNIKSAIVNKTKIAATHKMEDYLNTEKWESQASISCDGNLIFFASNRKGGVGGTDIWFSKRKGDGSWSIPKNAGLSINTPLDEEAPFISRDGSTLYFSSTGHLGLGEQDIFFSKLGRDDKWGQAINLGSPINTSYRELGLFVSADGKTGYFSSNRDDGFGGMDIYKFDLSENLNTKPITYVEGYVKDFNDKTPIQTVLNPNSSTPIPTDENGRFLLCLPANSDFKIDIEKYNYKKYEALEEIPLWQNKDFYPLEILLEPSKKVENPIPVIEAPIIEIDKPVSAVEPIIIRHSIYFEFGKHNLDAENSKNLKELIRKLANKNIQSIDIRAYCDHIGNDEYNKTLSSLRAKTIANFFSAGEVLVENLMETGLGKLPYSDAPEFSRRADIIIVLR